MSKKIEKSSRKLLSTLHKPKLALSKTTNSKSLESLPCSSPKSYFIRNLSQPTLPLPRIPGVSISHVRSLFNARCRDLSIDPIPSQAERFHLACHVYFNNRKVSLKDTNIGLASVKVLAHLLSSSSFFSSLDLSSNKIGNKGASILTKHLKTNLSVVHVDLSNNSISSEGAATVFKNLMDQHSVVSIDLHSHEGFNRNTLGKKAAIALRDLLFTNRLISHINIARTSLNSRAISLLAKGLERNQSILTLDLSHNTFTTVTELCMALGESSIYKLNLSFNQIGDGGSIDLAGLIADHPCLSILDLSSTSITSEGLANIWTGVHSNSVLAILKLNGNNFQEGLGSHMNVAFNFNTSLKELHLNQCQLSDSSVVPLYETLLANKGIGSLFLAKNNIADNGVTAIASGLWNNKSLLSLNLDNNRISVQGLRALMMSLIKNKDFHSISIRENNLDDSSVGLLLDSIRKMPHLLYLNIEGNSIKSRDLKDLQLRLARNKNNLTKLIVPRLREQVQNLTADFERIQITERLLQKNKNKKRKITVCLNEQEKKLRNLKQKTVESTNKTERLNNFAKDQTVSMSKELVQCLKQLKVSEATMKSEVHSWLNKNAHITSDVLEYEKRKSKAKEILEVKRVGMEENLEKIKEKLAEEERKLILAIYERDSALSRLSELKNIEISPNKAAKQKKAFYLASEKLAASKREVGLYPRRLKTRTLNSRSSKF